MNVYFLTNDPATNLPGAVLAQRLNQAFTGGADFSIDLSSPVNLTRAASGSSCRRTRRSGTTATGLDRPAAGLERGRRLAKRAGWLRLLPGLEPSRDDLRAARGLAGPGIPPSRDGWATSTTASTTPTTPTTAAASTPAASATSPSASASTASTIASAPARSASASTPAAAQVPGTEGDRVDSHAARARIRRANCSVGRVRKVRSQPRRPRHRAEATMGRVLPRGARVTLVVGPR